MEPKFKLGQAVTFKSKSDGGKPNPPSGTFYVQVVLPDGIPAQAPRTYSVDEPVYIVTENESVHDEYDILDAPHWTRESAIAAAV